MSNETLLELKLIIYLVEIEDCLRNFLVLGEKGNKKYYGSRAHVEFMPQDKNPAPYLFQFSL